VFDERWITLFVFIAALGVLLRIPALAALGVIGVCLASSTAWLQRRALRGIAYERRFNETRLFVGETVTVSGHVFNRGRLPAISVQIDDNAPKGFRRAEQAGPLERESPEPSDWRAPAPADEEEDEELAVPMSQLLALKPGEHTSRSVALRATRRGYFAFGQPRLRAFDLLGMSLAERADPSRDALIVYPQIFPLDKLGIPTRDPFGAMPAMRRLIEDPSLVMGSRDYQYGDSFRQIHWKASAHMSRLQTRVCEHTSDPTAMILLNVTTLRHDWHGTDVVRFEWALSVAGSVATWADGIGCTVGLSSNGCAPNMPEAIRVKPRRSPRQLSQLMESLAVLASFTALHFDLFVLTEQRHLPFGATMIVITPLLTPELEISLQRLHTLGKRIILISVDYSAAGLDRLPFLAYHVPPPTDLAFRREAAISLSTSS
jgi:uncharacterized protein (DUF58 family)